MFENDPQVLGVVCLQLVGDSRNGHKQSVHEVLGTRKPRRSPAPLLLSAAPSRSRGPAAAVRLFLLSGRRCWRGGRRVLVAVSRSRGEEGWRDDGCGHREIVDDGLVG